MSILFIVESLPWRLTLWREVIKSRTDDSRFANELIKLSLFCSGHSSYTKVRVFGMED